MMYLRRQLPSPSFPTRFAPLVQARGPSSPSSSSFRLIIGLRAKSITLPSPIFLARMNGGLSVSQSPLKHILSQNSFHQVSFPSFTNERKWAFQIIPSIPLYVRSKYACNFVIFENMIGWMVVVCLFQLLNEFWKFISEIRVADPWFEKRWGQTTYATFRLLRVGLKQPVGGEKKKKKKNYRSPLNALVSSIFPIKSNRMEFFDTNFFPTR